MKKDFLARAGIFLILGSVLLLALFVAEKQRLQNFALQPSPAPGPALDIDPSPAPSSSPIESPSPVISPKVEQRKPVGKRVAQAPTPSPIPTPSESPLPDWPSLASRTIVSLLCGNSLPDELKNATYGSGVLINSSGEILTNNHVVYDDSTGIVRSDCFVLKQETFGDVKKPKVYYRARTLHYSTNLEGYSGPGYGYGNDFAIVKIQERVNLQNLPTYLNDWSVASESDFSDVENSPGVYRWYPFDWSYVPSEGDYVVLIGYAAKDRGFPSLASIGGNISGIFYIIHPGIVESIRVNIAITKGMSGGIVINPQTGKAIGLNYATTESAGDFLYRDFINSQMLEDFGFSLTGE